MPPSATPATQSEGGCHQVPRLARKVPRRHRRPSPPKRATRGQPSAISATPATQNQSRCLQVPRLPRKTTVNVALGDASKCHACHAKRRWMSPSATPATQSAAASPATKPAQARHQSQPSAISATPATQNQGRCLKVERLPRKAKVDVTKYKVVCESWRSCV